MDVCLSPAYCKVDQECRKGRMCRSGVCVCLPSDGCAGHHKPVCGSDGVQYPSFCELHRTACVTHIHIKVDHTGSCFTSRESVSSVSVSAQDGIIGLGKAHTRSAPSLNSVPKVALKNNRLVGLVVKASASRAEGPGFESRLRRDFFGVESYQWLKNWHSSDYPARRLAL